MLVLQNQQVNITMQVPKHVKEYAHAMAPNVYFAGLRVTDNNNNAISFLSDVQFALNNNMSIEELYDLLATSYNT
jgi:hypothetical protein